MLRRSDSSREVVQISTLLLEEGLRRPCTVHSFCVFGSESTRRSEPGPVACRQMKDGMAQLLMQEAEHQGLGLGMHLPVLSSTSGGGAEAVRSRSPKLHFTSAFASGARRSVNPKHLLKLHPLSANGLQERQQHELKQNSA